jgi:protein-S-isoprenylcysteine O-methyltransferase Ste14
MLRPSIVALLLVTPHTGRVASAMHASNLVVHHLKPMPKLFATSLHRPTSFSTYAARCLVRMTDEGQPVDERSLEQAIEQVVSNMNEGELSTRGEGWFIAQACLLFGVLAAPPEPVAPVVELVVGLASISCGLALGTAAVQDLGLDNLTPWPKPIANNELKTEGVYSLCRHPMYTCLLLASFGLSLVTLSFERLLLTVALFSVLSFKAGREEAFLNEKHGLCYRTYTTVVPQFFPSVDAVRAKLLE